MRTKNNSGFSLLELLISTTIGLVIISITMHYLCIISKINIQLQEQFEYQHAQLIADHYLSVDVRNASSISTDQLSANNLLLYYDTKQQTKIIYYLRKSITPSFNHLHSYTLYRDDQNSVAIALVEGIVNFQVTIKQAIYISILFKNNQKLELIFARRNFNPE